MCCFLEIGGIADRDDVIIFVCFVITTLIVGKIVKERKFGNHLQASFISIAHMIL